MKKEQNWELTPAAESFPALAGQWDALNARRGNHITLDSKFVGALVRHFAVPNVFLAVSKKAQRPGMALVYKQKPGLWEIFTPSQGPLGPVLLAENDTDGEQVRELMNSLPGYPVQLALLRQDPEYSAWFPVQEGSLFEPIEYIQTGRIRLEGNFEQYWAGRSSNLRHNLRRQRKRLAEQGRTLTLLTHTDAASMASCIQEFGHLESAGWKAALGSAVNENNIQGHFYRDMFESFCVSGETIIYQLLIDGKVAATDLCLLRDGMLVVLKTTYDESLQGLSAALLMREEIVKQIFSDPRFRVIEFYGRAQEWHTKWTADFRAMYHINYHRNSVVSGLRDLVRSMR